MVLEMLGQQFAFVVYLMRFVTPLWNSIDMISPIAIPLSDGGAEGICRFSLATSSPNHLPVRPHALASRIARG